MKNTNSGNTRRLSCPQPVVFLKANDITVGQVSDFAEFFTIKVAGFGMDTRLYKSRWPKRLPMLGAKRRFERSLICHLSPIIRRGVEAKKRSRAEVN